MGGEARRGEAGLRCCDTGDGGWCMRVQAGGGGWNVGGWEVGGGRGGGGGGGGRGGGRQGGVLKSGGVGWWGMGASLCGIYSDGIGGVCLVVLVLGVKSSGRLSAEGGARSGIDVLRLPHGLPSRLIIVEPGALINHTEADADPEPLLHSLLPSLSV
uniref:Uncharacterized protein n=1 Tax=Knipowitschia caucasica TaxID=637954 RepID=A0AAV2KBY2_KNICA